MKTILAASAAVVIAGVSTASAQSVLNGSIYFESAGQTSGFTQTATVANAVTDINSQSPVATFVSNNFINGANYNGSDGSTLPQILTSNGHTDVILTDTTGGSSVGSFVMDLKGTLTVDTSGTYTFTNNNDDGGAFFVGGTGVSGTGTELAQNDGDHAPAVQSGTDLLTAGTSYNFEYIGYNDACSACGYIGTTAQPGGGVQFAGTITGPGAVVVTAVPEPAAVVALLGGAGMLLGLRRRRA